MNLIRLVLIYKNCFCGEDFCAQGAWRNAMAVVEADKLLAMAMMDTLRVQAQLRNVSCSPCSRSILCHPGIFLGSRRTAETRERERAEANQEVLNFDYASKFELPPLTTDLSEDTNISFVSIPPVQQYPQRISNSWCLISSCANDSRRPTWRLPKFSFDLALQP